MRCCTNEVLYKQGVVHPRCCTNEVAPGVEGYCALAGVFQTSVQPNQDQNFQDFQASSTPLGQSGSQVRDDAVGWCCVEDAAGVESLFRGVGNCGVGARG